jgi:hypothetical protein
MTTWAEVNGRLSYFLDDNPAEGGTYLHALPLRIAAWNWAQRIFQAHTKREQSADVTVGSDGRTAALPSDFLDVVMIYDTASYQVYGRRQWDQRGQRSAVSANYAYWVWNGQLYFDTSLPSTVRLEYLATWPEVTFTLNEDDEVVVDRYDLAVPQWAELPLVHLTAAQVLQPQAIQAAMSRNSNIRIDSGQPEDNSRRVQAREHYWWYQTLIGLVPPQVKGYGAN